MAGHRALRALAVGELIAGLLAVPILSASQGAPGASGTHGSSRPNVAQIATPAGSTQPALAVASLASSDVPAPSCQAADLAVSAQDIKVAMGTVQATYRVQSTGSTVCSLAATDTGWLKPTIGSATLTAVGTGANRTLAPGAGTSVDAAFRNNTPEAQSAPAPAQSPPPALPGLPAVPKLPTVAKLPTGPKLPAVPSQPPAAPPVPAPSPGAPAGGLGKIASSATTLPQSVGGAVNGVAALVTTTTRPPAPPPRAASPPTAAPSGPTTYSSGARGYDVSWPQCGSSYPPSAAIGVVGVNNGRAFTTNPCLRSEADWAGEGLQLYMNLNSPSDGSDPYAFGYNAAAQSVGNAANQGVRARTWWLDIETVGQCGNYWSCDQAANSATIQGALDALRGRNLTAGVYSTSYQWGVITGGYNPSGGAPPNWLAGVYQSRAGEYCAGGHNFAGGRTWMDQIWDSQSAWDEDQAC